MEIFKYYGVDWIIFLVVVTQLWLVGNKNRLGFLFGVTGNSFGVILGFMVESLACMMMNCVFIIMHLRGYYIWSHPNKEEKT
jgi:nicotinamide riboside transporter PnuC